MHFLRQNSQVDVRIGPAMSYSDGVSPITSTLSLSVANAAELMKHDGAATVDISGRTFAAVTGVPGWYDLTLITSDLDTCGQLDVAIQDNDKILPIFKSFTVIPREVYDSLIADSDKLQVDVTQIVASATAATNLRQGALGSVTLIVGTGSSSSSIVTDLSETTVDHYAGRVLVFLTGNLAGQATDISAYNGSGTLTVTALTEAPANSDTAIII